MKILITGERGFIGRNLIEVAELRGHEVIRLCSTKCSPYLSFRRTNYGILLPYEWREPCVFKNSSDVWARAFEKLEVDLVIHNAAVVGTDVVALNPNDAVSSNVAGTYNIVRACEKTGVPVSYMGTTVIYDTPKYQDTLIDETSDVKPITLYGQLKLTGDMIVREAKVDSNIIRPLFAYGGIGDMNSLIAKSIFAAFEGRDKLDMFLDPTKYKDYMHVVDYCNAVIMAAEKKLWNDDFIVAAEEPHVTGEIVEIIDKVIPRVLSACESGADERSWPPLNRIINRRTVPSEIIQWHPETDYLGNHRLSSKSFREASGWKPEVILETGIPQVAESILEGLVGGSHYNPLRHLDEADRRNVDLTSFY